jgi:hypothetical protein
MLIQVFREDHDKTFVELFDLFEESVCCFSVQAGKTMIERNSKDFSVVSPDPDSYRTMYKKVQDAFESKTQYYIDKVSICCHYTYYQDSSQNYDFPYYV